MKRRLQVILIVISVFSSCLFSCNGRRDYGPIKSQNRKVKDFTKIEVNDGIDVYVSKGKKDRVIVETNEELLEQLVTEVKGETLKIYFDGSFNWGSETTVYVKTRELEEIEATAGSDVVGEDLVESKHLSLKATGGSDIKIEVKTSNLELMVSGGSDIILKGKTNRLRAVASGGSDLKAFELITQKADLDCSGGSDITVTVERELNAKASGGSDIKYKGNPNVVKINNSSSSDITKED